MWHLARSPWTSARFALQIGAEQERAAEVAAVLVMSSFSVDFWPASVHWYDITLPTPAENLALDEVLLNDVDADPQRACLRTWEPTSDFVVVGRSNQVEVEVNGPVCRQEEVRIYRRSSGGGAVLVGRGCLGFAVVLPLTDEIRATGVVAITQRVMGTIAAELESLVPGIHVCGTSDLVVGNRKFSGNSQRWLKHAFLHHGTILYDYDLAKVQRLLKAPSRQPEYRSQRDHSDFIMNFPAPREAIVTRLVAAWKGQTQSCSAAILDQAKTLAQSRYEQDEWNLER